MKLRIEVAAGTDPDVIVSFVVDARDEAVELDRLVTEGGILDGHQLLRHLGWALRLASDGKLPDKDAADLIERDFPALVGRLHGLVEEVDRGPAVRRALAGLEGSTVEFTEDIPKNAHSLAKEFAALGSSGGSVYLGVGDDGRPVGLSVRSAEDIDKLDLRIRGILRLVQPAIRAEIHWLALGPRVFAEILIEPSDEPIHFVEHRAYVRDGSQSRPAEPAEIIRAVRDHTISKPLISIEPGGQSELRGETGTVAGAFAHVRVTNTGSLRLFDVRGWALFASAEDSRSVGVAMPLRWSGTPAPTTPVWSPSGFESIPDPSKVPIGAVIGLAPGDGDDAAIAVKFRGEESAWGWTGESYLHGARHPSWMLPPGKLSVEVRVRADGRDFAAVFELDTDVDPERFVVIAPSLRRC